MLTDLALWRRGAVEGRVFPVGSETKVLALWVDRFSGFVAPMRTVEPEAVDSDHPAWQALAAIADRTPGAPSVDMVVVLDRGDVLVLGLDLDDRGGRWRLVWIDASPVLD